MNLDQAQLQKRSKELDAQQEYIDTQRRLLDDAPITLKVYEAQYTAKQEQLESLQEQIAESEKLLASVISTAKQATDKSKVDLAQLDTKVNELYIRQTQLKDDIASKGKKVKELETEASDLRKYILEQDTQINELVESGNSTLLELNSQVAKLTHEVSLLGSEKILLQRERDELIVEGDALKYDFDDEITVLEAKKTQAESDLEAVRKSLRDYQAQYDAANTEVAEKLALLDEKEASITAKRDAMILEKQELDEDKRRWGAKKALYE